MAIDFIPLASSSKGNCYFLSDGHTNLMLEAGIPMKAIRSGMSQHVPGRLSSRLSGLSACLITHNHGDHAKAVKDVLKAGIDCYMTRGTAAALDIASDHRVRIVEPLKKYSIGSWVMIPFKTEHDAPDPVGFMLASPSGKVLFATDTYYISNQFKGLTHIAVECNYAIDILNANVEAGSISPARKKRLLQSHFSLENVKKFLAATDLSQCREIWLIHLSDDNSDEDRFKREIQEQTGIPVRIA